jgi:DNA primase
MGRAVVQGSPAGRPGTVSWKWQITDRGGLAGLDYTQNWINETPVAPCSPRAVPGAPVSAPIEWGELDDPDLSPELHDPQRAVSNHRAR